MHAKFEQAYADEAPYRTTIIAKRAGFPTILVEVLLESVYPRQLRELRRWLFAEHLDVELYVSFSPESQGAVSTWSDLRSDGVGIIIVEKSGRKFSLRFEGKARNPALTIRSDPGVRLGVLAQKVGAAISKFNEVDRMDALRDMVEIVEGQTKELAILACRMGWLRKDEYYVSRIDWLNLINHLAATDTYIGGHGPLIDDNLKLDLQSFRGARNLFDHNARGRRKVAERQRQFFERMVQGPRLVHELLALCRKVRGEKRVQTPPQPPERPASASSDISAVPTST